MIKHLVLTTALISSPVFANIFTGIDYTYYSGVGKNSAYSANAYSISFGGKVYDTKLDSVILDVKTEYQDISDTDASVNQLEGGATYLYNLNSDWSVGGRLGLGNNWVSDVTKSNFQYYSVQPEVKYYPSKDASLGLGYRFRDSFETGDNYQTSAFRLNGEYSFDKHNSIVGGYDYSIGDQQYNAFKVGYLARF
jgi:hypothetical protein